MIDIIHAKNIASILHVSSEDIELAELIGLLHDIGRFQEITVCGKFDSVSFDHASYGVKILFKEGMIRNFITDNQYDQIICEAIKDHSMLSISEGLDKKSLLHAKIIRDADKLDNLRVKNDEKIEAIYPSQIKEQKDIENSKISDNVYRSIQAHQCVNIHDRKTPLDYWLCVLAFIFDLNFPVTMKIIQEENDIDRLIDRFQYRDAETRKRIAEIRDILKQYINDKIAE